MPSKSPPPQRVQPSHDWPLFDTAATRKLEQIALARSAENGLMQRAGLATARLALAMAPHSQTIWIAAGPGNNGGDGMQAALHLHQWGKQVVVTWLGDPQSSPSDAASANRRARAAGVFFANAPPDDWDLCIDALLGIGAARPPSGLMAQWIVRMNAAPAPILSVDMPTGLHADTGVAAPDTVRASATLCLLTLKPGLFTADGRDHSMQVWLDELQINAASLLPELAPSARLSGAPACSTRRHATHKGSYGSLAVVGGAPGMAGAALLAAMAAVHAGAGKVFLCPLDDRPPVLSADHAELMLRDIARIDPHGMTVVVGCGGGERVRAHLPRLLSTAARLVLDADALNALANDAQLQGQLRTRAARNLPSVLTPHPLEAARLLKVNSAQIQSDRIGAAQQLAAEYQCVVVVKGSGTVITAPGRTPRINPTGNARLATAGTGDVLAGMVGAALATGMPAFEAACTAVYRHGAAADRWPADTGLSASRLANAPER